MLEFSSRPYESLARSYIWDHQAGFLMEAPTASITAPKMPYKQTNYFLGLGYDWKYSFGSVQLYCAKCSQFCIFHIYWVVKGMGSRSCGVSSIPVLLSQVLQNILNNCRTTENMGSSWSYVLIDPSWLWKFLFSINLWILVPTNHFFFFSTRKNILFLNIFIYFVWKMKSLTTDISKQIVEILSRIWWKKCFNFEISTPTP